MRWTPGRRSENLEDRRGESIGGGFRGIGVGRLGIGGTILLVLLSIIFRSDFISPAAETDNGEVATSPGAPVASTPGEEHLVDFVSFVLDTVQSTWTRIMPQIGTQYRDARMVLFRDVVESACGMAESATGPFYCPDDERVYLDLGFLAELKSRFGAPGDFAQAYVIAHEIGHHVQKLLGIESQVRAAMQERSSASNRLSVRVELQADCFAGVWGNRSAQQNLLEPGDIEEGLGAAAAVGDDRLQRTTTGRVSPETFTHGSSAQRVAWFKRGFASGRVEDCDTFAAR